MDEHEAILLGRGWLNWPSSERVSDRYGLVHLMDNFDRLDPIVRQKPIDGEHGKLVAVVQKTRQSRHIGDLFRGLQPTTPKVGEEIELGDGVLTFDYAGNVGSVGVIPDDDRGADWLDPRQLYRVHDQYVWLYFVPTPEPKEQP